MIPFCFPVVFYGLLSQSNNNQPDILNILCSGQTAYSAEDESLLFDGGNATRYIKGVLPFPKKRIRVINKLPHTILEQRIELLLLPEPQMTVSKFHALLLRGDSIEINDESLNKLCTIVEESKGPIQYIAVALLESFHYGSSLDKESQAEVVNLPQMIQDQRTNNLFHQYKREGVCKNNLQDPDLPEKIRSTLHELRISADYVSFSDNFWNLFGIRNKPSPSRTKTFFRYILHSLFADKIEEDIGAVIFGLNLVTDADTSLYSRRDYYLKNSFYLNDKMGNDYCPYSWSSDDRKESAILMLRQDENSVSEAVYQYIIDTLLSNKNEIERSPEALTAEINLLCDMADRQFANVALSNT